MEKLKQSMTDRGSGDRGPSWQRRHGEWDGWGDVG